MPNPYLTRLNSFGKRRPTNLTCISLFSGGGGLDLGAYLARFKTLLASDVKPSFIQTIKHNLPEVKIYSEDAILLTPKLLREISTLGEADLDLMMAGPPCQSFSILGRRGALEDPRGQLTVKYIELVAGMRPKVFVFENVPGLLNVNNGADLVTIHYEATSDLSSLIRNIKNSGVKVGVSIKPKTEVEVLFPYLKDLDLVLVMSVEPGFGGQSFIPSALEKIEKSHALLATLLKLNPLFYIVEGYRESFFYQTTFMNHPTLTIYFWVVTIAMYCLGSWLMYKFKSRFIDMM